MHSVTQPKLKYFDESTGWSEKRLATSQPFIAKTITVSSADFSQADAAEMDRFCELLGTDTPAVAILHHVSPVALNRLKNGTNARKMYALLETSRAEKQEESTVALIRLGLQCETTETTHPPEAKNVVRALLQMVFRSINNSSMVMYMVDVESSVSPHRRVALTGTLLQWVTSADVVMLVTNVADGLAHLEEASRELSNSRLSAGFGDVLEEGMEKQPTLAPSWSVWVKSTKLMVNTAAVEMMSSGQRPRYVCAALGPRTSQAANSIAIPRPRSLKSGSKSPFSSPAAAQVLSDPAVLSAEAAKKNSTTPGTGAPLASESIIRLLRKQPQPSSQQPQKWKLAQSFVLKGSEPKLMNTECMFDISNLFTTPSEAIEALNSKELNWPADYCVVQGTVLCADTVTHCDRQAFRRYAREAKGNSTLTSQIFSAIHNFTNTHVADKTAWPKLPRAEAEEFSSVPRLMKDMVRREWSESCCAIVYQITPREMKFNITHLVGMAKDNLQRSIHLLNNAKTGTKDTNPLRDYPYDYALLFSVERQGFWLIAASHVPCDIVACRMVV